jgi:hypothetical protein
MLNQKTISTLDELDAVEWFCNVGRKDSDYPVFLSSWDEAVKSCTGEQWESLCEEAANQYRARLCALDPGRFGAWNVIVREVKEVTIPFVQKKIQHIVAEKKLPKVFTDTIQWDILHLCMESEYADIFPPGFYASQAFWYARGHFPCGWSGDFPKGRLVVY